MEKSDKNRSKISERLAAIQADSTRWEKKLTKGNAAECNTSRLKDRVAAMESSQDNWKGKNNIVDSGLKRSLSERMASLNKSQDTWKSSTSLKSSDHHKLKVSHKAERFASPARIREMQNNDFQAKKEERRGRTKEKLSAQKIDIPKIVVSPEDACEEIPMSMIEKIASKKADDHVRVQIRRERKVPKQDYDELDKCFHTKTSRPHSVAIGELSSFEGFLPRESALLSSRPQRPRRKKSGRSSRNKLKSPSIAQDSYTEEITDLSARVSGKKFTNTALAGLAAREDLQNVRLRSASRKREDQSVWAHIVF